MILKEKNGEILEIRCDICKSEFDIKEEIDEFIRFNFVMGPKSDHPLKIIKGDVCQDCFEAAFPEFFRDDENFEEEGWTE